MFIWIFTLRSNVLKTFIIINFIWFQNSICLIKKITIPFNSIDVIDLKLVNWNALFKI